MTPEVEFPDCKMENICTHTHRGVAVTVKEEIHELTFCGALHIYPELMLFFFLSKVILKEFTFTEEWRS